MGVRGGGGLFVCQVHIYQSGFKEIDDESVEHLKYKNYTLHVDAAENIPLKWYEAQPVASKKIVVMHLQPESETVLSILWSGNLWNYRSALEEVGVKGAYVDEEEGDGENSGKRKYFRILKSIDATEETKRIQKVLKEVFQNLAMKVIVESEPLYDSEVAVLIEELRNVRNLHFEN